MDLIQTRLLRTSCELPNKIAIEECSRNWNLTYKDLQEMAICFWNFIKEKDIETVVLFYGDKDKWYYGWLFSVFFYKINFCPVDKVNPENRLLSIASQFKKCIILSNEKLSNKIGDQFEVVNTEKAFKNNYNLFEPYVFCVNPKYYIATSGSTGKPKLVEVEHSNTIDFITWSIKYYEIDCYTRWAQYSSIGFDLSIADFLTILCGGGCLITIVEKIDKFRPASTIEKARITHWHSVPSIIPYFLKENNRDITSCKLFTFCGEPLYTKQVEQLQKRVSKARIVNTYGPTETTLFCSYHLYDKTIEYLDTVSIGEPIPGWSFLLKQINENRFNLVIVSDNANNTYLNTASTLFNSFKLFDTNYFSFNTGDVVEYHNHRLFFVNRFDTMVKIQGNRIDLLEIENICRKIEVQNPVCIVFKEILCLFYEDNDMSEDLIKKKLCKLLAIYSIPRYFYELPLLPRNANGKIDRKKLKNLINERFS